MQHEAATIVDARRRTEIGDETFYATILNDVMSPRFDKDERVVYNKSLRPVIGDDVMIMYRSGKSGVGLVRRLMGFDGKNLRLLQYMPRTECDVSIDRVSEIYPVVAWEPPLA